MKLQVKRALKAVFVTKKLEKSRQVLHEIFFNLQYKCLEVPMSFISK